MRKRTRKLALSRETLHQLELGTAATRVLGGVVTVVGKTCPVDECTSSCNPLCSGKLDCCP